MDYSLYLVIERRNGDFDQLTRNEFISSDGTELYHVSVIDYLQEWNAHKRTEHWLKSFKVKDILGISAVEPVFYKKRFCDFMRT